MTPSSGAFAARSVSPPGGHPEAAAPKPVTRARQSCVRRICSSPSHNPAPGFETLKTRRVREPAAASPYSELDKPIQFLKGVGPKRADILKRLGILTARD